MEVTIHNAKRTRCETMYVEYSIPPHQEIALIEFECESKGSVVMFFNDPEALLEHATAMKLLAEALEEEQSK